MAAGGGWVDRGDGRTERAQGGSHGQVEARLRGQDHAQVEGEAQDDKERR